MSLRVVVTAGASGIGLAMVRAFMNQDARVAICDVDQTALDTFSTEHPECIAMRACVTEETDMDRLFDRVETEWGGVDVVCANAGTGGPAGAVESIGLDEWQTCVAVNLDGAFLTARRAASAMKKQGSGLLLFTSSTAGLFGYPMRTPYASAKWAVIGLMKSLAMELGPHGVRVNALCPGAVEGERMNRVIANEARARNISEETIRQNYVKCVSMKTWVKAEDIANTATFLASPAGDKISGQALSIDGHTEILVP